MSEPELKISSVLFIDIVDYSLRTGDQQLKIVQVLNRLVRGTPTMINTPEKDRFCLPTGDGLMVSFFRNIRSPVHCALQLDEQLKAHNRQVHKEQRFELRMGINYGPVYTIKDFNQRENVIGPGINQAQRVMDFGYSRHILISQGFANLLACADSTLKPIFHPLGKFEDKHGKDIAIANIYDGNHGNPKRPKICECGKCSDTIHSLSVRLASKAM